MLDRTSIVKHSELRLLPDYRLGGRFQYVLTEASRLVLVSAEMRKCVAFVGMNTAHGRRLVGTCAFLAVGPEDWHWIYAVTAAHVIEGIRDTPGTDGKVFLRMNMPGPEMRWVESSVAQWAMHPSDPVADVAALPFPGPTFQLFDHVSFSMDSSATEKVIERERIGVGDEVFLTGLFVNHSGTARNIPIVRSGAIAAMPEEKIETRRGLMYAYLIEARSIGGLSGSPVFVRVPPVIVREGQLLHTNTEYGAHYLLGLMHGHWQVDAARLDALAEDNLREEIVNMGIGMVVPVETILEVLDQPRLREPREAEARERAEANLPVPDATEPQQPS